jgi:hypothetical protein
MITLLIFKQPKRYMKLRQSNSTEIYVKTMKVADPVAARSEARALSASTLNRGFECRFKYGYLSSSVCVVLSCEGRGLATS